MLGIIKVNFASAFDFIVEFAIARHSLNKFNSALAYTQISLSRRFPFESLHVLHYLTRNLAEGDFAEFGVVFCHQDALFGIEQGLLGFTHLYA